MTKNIISAIPIKYVKVLGDEISEEADHESKSPTIQPTESVNMKTKRVPKTAVCPICNETLLEKTF